MPFLISPQISRFDYESQYIGNPFAFTDQIIVQFRFFSHKAK